MRAGSGEIPRRGGLFEIVQPAGAVMLPTRGYSATLIRAARLRQSLGNTMMRRVSGRYKGAGAPTWWRALTGQVHVPNDYGSISFEVAELQFPVYDRLDLFLEALEKF